MRKKFLLMIFVLSLFTSMGGGWLHAQTKNGVSSTSAKTITLFEDGFEDDFTSLDEEFWTRISADENENNWYLESGKVVSLSYSSKLGGELTPDNYIVTKNKYQITESSVLTIESGPYSDYIDDTYSVVISEDNEVWISVFSENFSDQKPEQEIIEEEIINLGEYSGKNVHIGVRHYYGDPTWGNGVVIDKIKLTGAAPAAEPVAKIGDTPYNSLDEAVAAAQNGETITLVADVELTAQVVIPEGKVLTLDLNGKTVNSVFNGNSTTNHIYALSNKGTLTINDSKGNGSINSRGIYNYGSLTLNAGAINAIDGNGGYAVNNQSGSTFVMNGGVVAATNEDDNQSSSGGYDATALKVPAGSTTTLNGGTINNVCDFTYAIDAAGTLNIPATSTITVNGTHGAIAVSGGETTIDAGTFQIPADEYSRTDNVLYVSGGSLVVNGGTFIGDSDTASGGSCLYDAAGKAVVNGGTFKGSSGGDVWGTTGTTIKGGTFENLTEKQHIAAGYELGADGTVAAKSVAEVNGVKYTSFAAAIEAAQAGSEIKLLANIEGDITVPANVTLNGNGFAISGGILAEGDITFAGVTTAADFDANVANTAVNIPAGASLQLTGSARLVIGHGATFNITGTIEDAKTADKATLVPSLKIAAGASITGNGVTFNVNNAYIVANANTTSKNSSANGVLDFNINNSIWEQTGVLAFYVPTSGKDPVVNFELKNSVLTTTSHLVFSVTKGEIVIDNSLVNQGTSRQIENRSTMTIKNGSVVNGAVATSSNAINPGTIIVDNATYAVTGEFSGAAEGTGTIIIKKGANVSAGSITKANITIDAEGMTSSDAINLTANLSNLTGTLSVINNDKLEAKIVDGKIVLAAKPVAKIGDTPYTTLDAAFTAATEGQTITLLADATPALTSQRAITKAAVIDLGGKTMTLTEDDLYFGTTTFKNGTIVVDPSVKPSTAVFWMFANQTLTFDNVKVVATGVTGTYLIGLDGNNSDLNLLNGSEILVENTTALDLDIICVNASTGNDIKVENSKVNVTNLDGRVFFRGNYTVKDSEVNLAGITKAGFRIEAGQKLSIEGTSKINIEGELRDGGIHLTDLTATYTKAETATVNATINEVTPAATIGTAKYASLQAAIDAVQNGETIVLTKDCAEVVSINKSNVAFTINGKISDTENIAYTGKIQINVGQNVTVKNINFSHAGDEAHDFIANVGSPTGKNYNTTLLVEGCSFVGANNNYNTVAVRTIHPTHTQIKNSTGTGLHSFLQNTGGQQVTVEGVVLTDSKGGLAIGSPNGAVSVKGCDLTTNTYGVRLDANNTNAPGTTLENNKVNAYIPVSVRKATAPNYNLTFNGEENAYVATNGDNVWCAVCTTEYEEGVALNAPTGKVRVTLNDTELSYEGVYGNYYELAGEGTAENPYLINSVYDLKYFRDKVDEQAQDGSTQFAGKYFKLTADLDLAGINWNPIGSMSGDHGSFKGVFDGGNHTISNLNCEQAGNGLGLFARTAGNAEIKNLKLNNVTVKSTDNSNYVGGVVGNAYASTKINNVLVSGTINIAGRGYIGGIAGHGYVVMDNVSVVANEGSLITSTFWCAGGILGYAGEGSTNIMNANVEGITITSAAGGLGAIVGMAEDNEGTQPISGSNLSAKNVEIKTYVGAYGTYYEDYAIGYLYGGNPTSKLTGELNVENVTLTNASGKTPAEVSDAVANVDGKIYFAFSNNEFKLLENGNNVTILRAGKYSIPTGKDLTITGAVNGVVFENIGAYGMGGANVTFNNVTFNYADNSTYKGLQHSGNLVYNKCTINGQVFLYGASETFNNCTFSNTGDNYNVWTYGAKEVAFNGCTFNCDGKSVLIYTEGKDTFNNVTVTECIFNASKAVEGKAAIEMDSSLSKGINLTIDGKTTATGFGTGNVSGNSLWNNKKGNNTDANNDITVKVNGETVLAPVAYAAKIGNVGYQTLAAAVSAAQTGDVVKVFEGTHAVPTMKAGITIEGVDGVILEGTLSGTLENLTLKNLHIKGANAQRWAYAKGNLLFENVTFEATSVYALHFDGITAGATLTYKDCTIIGWAAMSGSPASCTFDGCTFKGNGTYGLIRTYFDATITNCTFDVANVNTTDKYQDGIHAVEGAIVTVNGCTNVNGNMNDVVNVSGTSVVVLDGVEIKNAAKIGEKYYRTLAEAYEAVQVGETLTLLADINLSEILVINKAITLDGNGKTLTSTAGRAINVSGADGVKIQNLTINASGERAINIIQNATNVTIDNVTAKSANYTVNVASSASAAVVAITNSNLTGLNVVNVAAQNADVTIDNTTITTVDNAETEGYSSVCLNKDGVNGKIVATNTTINLTGSNTNGSHIARNGAVGGYVSINGSTDDVAVDVAYISYGNNYYGFQTIEAAIAKASTEAIETIELLRDVDASAFIAIDKSLTINGNGHNVTSSATRVFRVTKSNVEVTLNNVNMVSSAVRVGQNDVRGISIDAELTNVKLTLNGCSVDFTDASANDWSYAVNVSGNGTGHTVTVNGGTYEGANVINVNGANNTVVVKDATLNCIYLDSDAYAGACIWVLQNQGSSVEATGNTFNGDNAVAFNLGTGTALTESNNTDNTTVPVAKVGNTYYKTIAAAVNAAQAGETVKVFVAGTYAVPTMKAGITIEGVDGVILEGTLSGTLENLTLKNLHIKGANAQRWAYAKGNLLFENVTFEATSVYALHFDGITAGATLTYKDCTIIGWAAMSGSPASCTFDGCTFKGNGTYGLIRTYFDATITNCTFDVANVNTTDNYQEGIHAVNGATVTVNSCTNVNGNMNDVVNVSGNSMVVLDGKKIRNVAKIGNVSYTSLQAAIDAANNGETITLSYVEANGPIEMNAALYGKNVTITGTATVDWSKGFLFVGRGGNGNATLTFDNANLTSASNGASYGIHVSGREKNTNNKYDGIVAIKNSTIVLDYLINKGVMTLDNSNLTVKNGFAVGGRPASETESGEDATATLTLSNNSKVVVNNHNGMGLGYEAIGVMNIDETSTFETTQSFLVTAKGTINNAGTAKVEGTLTNKGTINFTAATATLYAQEGLTINTALESYDVIYEDGAYKLNAVVAKIGDVKYATFKEALEAIGEGDVVIKLLNNVTMDITAWQTLAIGAANTTSITIDGENGDEDFTLTFNKLNSDWNHVATSNDNATKLILKNLQLADSGKNNGPWNRYDHNFACDVELTNVVSNKAIAFKAGATLNNVTINEERDNYAIWIQPNGQNISINGLTVNSAGRGIKIDNQYVDNAQLVNLTLKDATFTTVKKAAIMVKTPAGANITAENVDITKIAADPVNLVWVDEDGAANFGEVAVTGGTVAQESIEEFFAANTKDAKVEGYYKTLQAAVNAAQDGETVSLLKDIAENVTVSQNNGINIVIDGQNHNFSGTITIDGNSRTTGESLTIQNVNFVTNVASLYFIDANSTANTDRYPHNVTVKDCTFTAEENSAAVNTAVAMRFRQGFNIAVENVTAVRLHSLMQNYGVSGVTVNDVEVDGKNGIALGTSTNVTVTDATIKAVGYGLRVDASVTTPITIADSEIEAFIPVVVRTATANTNITFNGANDMRATNGDNVWCVIGKDEYEEGVELEDIEAATGKVVVDLSESNLTYEGVYGNYAVAKIGEVQYASLQAAIEDAQNGDTVILFANTDEVVSVNVLNKKISIVGEEALFPVLTGGLDFGIDNHSQDAGNITIKGIKFVGNGIKIDDMASVTIEGNIFEDITASNAIYVAADEYTTTLAITNNIITNVAGAGINLRNPINATIKDNAITNTTGNAMTFQNDGAIEDVAGEIVITGNVLTDWAYGKTEGRAIRLALGNIADNVIIEENAMIAANATEEFVKISGTSNAEISVDENYWNGVAPTAQHFLADGVQIHNYYASYDEANGLQDLVTIAGETLEIFYTAAGVETTKEQAVYSLSFAVTDYVNKEASVKIGKKPTKQATLNLPTTVEFNDIEYTITLIPANAFHTCYHFVGDLVIPATVKRIENGAFQQCFADSGEKLGTLTLNENLTYIGNAAFLSSRFKGDLVVPSSVEYVGNYAFNNSGMDGTLTINRNVTNRDGFNGSKFTKLVVSEGVTSVGFYRAFAGMKSLKEVTLPSTLKEIGNEAFYEATAINKVYSSAFEAPAINNNNAFDNVVKDNATLCVEYYKNYQNGEWAEFANVYSEFVIQKEGYSLLVKVNDDNCSVQIKDTPKDSEKRKLEIPAEFDYFGTTKEITSIAANGFKSCNFYGEVVVPGTIKTVGNNAFNSCYKINRIVFENGVESIGRSTLGNMYALTYVEFPASLKTIGNNCFTGYGENHKIITIVSYATEVPVAEAASSFQQYVADKATLYVFEDVVSKYKNATGWSRFKTIKPIEAKIGETVYYSLAKAIEASKAGDVITLIADVETAEANPIIIPEGVTLDINTHDITANIYGTVKTTGGLWTTVAVPGFNSRDMLGEGAIYNTTDATVVNLANEVNVLAGTIVLNPHPETEWWTLPGQSLSIATGATFEIPSDVKFTVREGNANVNGTLINNGTLAINAGATVTGNLTGDIHFLGGNFITADGYNMVGTTSEYYYNATNALVNIESTFGDITILSGAMTLGQSWRTVQGQTLTVAEGASFTVPTGMTFKVFANTHVVVEGTLVTDGTVYLQAGATVRAEAGLNIQTTVAGHVVDYNNGVYSVIPIYTQTIQLKAGWNWFSSYVETDLESLQAALGTSGVKIKDDNLYTDYYAEYDEWYGSLNSYSYNKMYMIKATEDIEISISGNLINTNDIVITLVPGWNWISYPNSESVDINIALQNLDSQEGDKIKSDSPYADYYEGYGWYGSLNTLEPGVGYMYYNSSNLTKTFTYSTSTRRSEAKANVTTEGNYWTPNAAQFANNMTMTAVLDVENINYEVAAFVNGECRGSARPIYVEALDAYMLFLTIHGEEVEEMTFKYYDIDTDIEYTLSDRINYSNNAILGSLKEPYMFTRGTTGIGEAELSQLNIYPNPTTTAAEINLNATFDKVEVFNALGVKVAEYNNVDSIDALETAGIYVIRATNNSVISHCRLVVK